MKKLLLTLLAAVLSAGIAFEAPAQKKPGCSLLVDKGAFTLSVLSDKGDTLMTFPVATGEKAGRKRKAGDCKTPEGTFTVTWVQNTKGVLYDYRSEEHTSELQSR